MYFNPGTARLNRFAGGGKRFEAEGKTESGSGNTRITIVLDRPAKTFRVLMDGKEIGKIAFKEDEANEALDACGMSLTPTYYSASSGTQNRITSIWLAPWDGPPAAAEKKETAAAAFARKAYEEAYGPAKKEDAAASRPEAKKIHAPAPIIHLANGDEFEGAIAKLTADLVTVDSDAGPLELPGKRVAWIHFPGGTVESPEHFPRLRFHDRGLLSVNDLQIGEARVKCRTLQGQALEFPLSLVKEVIWRAMDGR